MTGSADRHHAPEVRPFRASDRLSEPRSAYIHVPFCRHRCGYCNFTVVAGRDELIGAYLGALERELSTLEHPREMDTLFLGGGTPSHLSPAQLRQLLSIIQHWLPLRTSGEFSLEANPADIDETKVPLLVEGRVNRLSLGAQSFVSSKLEVLERDHRARELESACALAQASFPAWSVDLIFGVPGESLTEWRYDLEQILRLRPPHLSTYGLTIEKGTSFGTRFRKGQLPRVAEELEAEMYELAIELLTSDGWEHYEVSNFARPGFRSRHNEAYWRGQTYYGFGPGAARYVQGRRELNHRSTTTWMRRVLAGQSAIAESETLPDDESARERLVFGLRMREGVDRDEFRLQTGFDLETLSGTILRHYLDQGWLETSGNRIRLTRRGLLVSDSLWPDLL